MKILVLNCGSSSLKYKLFEMPQGDVLAQGLADRIGFPDALFRHKVQGREDSQIATPLPDHHAAVEAMLAFLKGNVKCEGSPLSPIPLSPSGERGLKAARGSICPLPPDGGKRGGRWGASLRL